MTSLSRPSDDRAHRPDAILLVNLASGRSTLATATSLANGAYLGRQEVTGVACCGADRPSRTRLDLISRTSPPGRARPQTSMDGLRRSCAAGDCRPRGCVRMQAGQVSPNCLLALVIGSTALWPRYGRESCPQLVENVGERCHLGKHLLVLKSDGSNGAPRRPNHLPQDLKVSSPPSNLALEKCGDGRFCPVEEPRA